MRNLLFRLLFRFIRALRSKGKRRLLSLAPGRTILYLQFEKPLGCCVHGTSLIPALNAAFPGVRLVVASRGGGAATLRHHPRVAELVVTRADPLQSPGALLQTLAELRRELRRRGIQVDAVVQDASNRRVSSALLAAGLRIAPTVGFGNAPALYDVHLAYNPSLSLIDNHLRIAGALGAAAQHHEPEVFFSPSDLQHARALLADVPRHRAGLIGFVVQGSGGQQTGWHDDRFGVIVREFIAAGYAAIFLGTGADDAAIARVRDMSGPGARSLAGQTTIPQAAAVLCLCDLLLTVDTGTMHLGRAVGVPMVVLGPSWQAPLEWLPLGLPQVRVLRGEDRTEVPPNYQLDEIGVPQVRDAGFDLLLRFPPSRAARELRVERRLSVTRV